MNFTYCTVHVDAELLEYLVMYDFAPELCHFIIFLTCEAELFVHSSSELRALIEQAQNIHIFRKQVVKGMYRSYE